MVGNGDMKGRLQSKAIEAEQSGGSWAVGPAGTSDRGDELEKFEQVACVDEGAGAPSADAAQVSDSKRHVVSLTIFDHPWVVVSGHAARVNLPEP